MAASWSFPVYPCTWFSSLGRRNPNPFNVRLVRTHILFSASKRTYVTHRSMYSVFYSLFLIQGRFREYPQYQNIFIVWLVTLLRSAHTVAWGHMVAYCNAFFVVWRIERGRMHTARCLFLVQSCNEVATFYLAHSPETDNHLPLSYSMIRCQQCCQLYNENIPLLHIIFEPP